MSFARRRIDLQFSLGQGAFGNDGADTISLSGLRCSVDISKVGGVNMSELDLRVFGMPLDTMNKLTTLNILAYAEQRDNHVIVSAGDESSGMAVVFSGTIKEAWADAGSAPDVFFHVSAFGGLYEGVKPVPPTSYNGSVDIARVINGIAIQMGFGFENSGVTGQVENVYLPGSLRAQLNAFAEHADIAHVIDDQHQVIAIWPKGKSRNAAAIEVSPETGLVGYPTFTQRGVMFTTLFNPSIVFGLPILLKSDFTAANGTFTAAAVHHNLDADVPGGHWVTQVECSLSPDSVPIINS